MYYSGNKTLRKKQKLNIWMKLTCLRWNTTIEFMQWKRLLRSKNEQLQICLEELQEGLKVKRREIETLICQINNWKTACKQSEYRYEILRKKQEESEKENKLLKRKIKDESTYENDLNNKGISIEDNTEELMGSGMSLIQVDSGCFLVNKYLIPFPLKKSTELKYILIIVLQSWLSTLTFNTGFQHWFPTLIFNIGLKHWFSILV